MPSTGRLLIGSASLVIAMACASPATQAPDASAPAAPPTLQRIQAGADLANEVCVTCHELPARAAMRSLTIPAWEQLHGRPSVVNAEQMQLIVDYANDASAIP